MKFILTPAIVAAVLGLSAAPAWSDAPQTCSLASLKGTMAWSGVTTRPGGVQKSSSGMESYDGVGHMKYFQLQSDGITQSKFSGTGTYTITQGCIATVVYDGDTANPWTYFVAPDGSTYFYNNNLGFGAISAGHVDRISRALLVQ